MHFKTIFFIFILLFTYSVRPMNTAEEKKCSILSELLQMENLETSKLPIVVRCIDGNARVEMMSYKRLCQQSGLLYPTQKDVQKYFGLETAPRDLTAFGLSKEGLLPLLQKSKDISNLSISSLLKTLKTTDFLAISESAIYRTLLTILARKYIELAENPDGDHAAHAGYFTDINPILKKEIVEKVVMFLKKENRIMCIKKLKGPFCDDLTALSLDGKYMLVGMQDGGLNVFSTKTWECIGSLKDDQWRINSVTIAPNGNIFAGLQNGTLAMWDIVTGKCLKTLASEQKTISFLTIAPHGKFIAYVIDDKTIKILNVKTLKCKQLKANHASISALAIAADNSCIIAGSTDGFLEIWDISSGEYVGTLPCESGINSIAISGDNMHVICGLKNGSILVWDAEHQKYNFLATNQESVFCVGISPNGQYIISGSQAHFLKIISVATGECIDVPNDQHASFVTFSRNGKHIISVAEGAIKIWGFAHEEALKTWQATDSLWEVVKIIAKNRS